MRNSIGLLGFNLSVWCAIAFGAGWWHRRTPIERLRVDGFMLGLRGFETAGEWHERCLQIKRWKARLPETGGRRGGLSKRRLPGRSRDDLERFAAECRRGERTHWTIVAAGPVFLIWNTWSDALAIAFANTAGNAPFLAVLRYNRARIVATLGRTGRQPGCTRDGAVRPPQAPTDERAPTSAWS